MLNKLFTIGYSNLGIDAFIELLLRHGITALVDVRSYPYSRYLPDFNQTALKAYLSDAKISYVFLGHELGARPGDPACYIDGKALYENIAATEPFSKGIQRILTGLERYTIALMCAEKDPITCHRAVLVCQYLREFGLDINHILQNGNVETHKQLEDRLLDTQGLSLPTKTQADQSVPAQLDLFGDKSTQTEVLGTLSREESLKEAYRRQGEQIAYIEKKEKHYEQVR
jgi:uncharacterized protein (DUF488 family)